MMRMLMMDVADAAHAEGNRHAGGRWERNTSWSSETLHQSCRRPTAWQRTGGDASARYYLRPAALAQDGSLHGHHVLALVGY